MDVSVVIPLHNGERYLAEALEAILRQTLPPREVLVVDNGSSDGGPRIAAAHGDRRVALVSAGATPDVQRARNAGIARARGEWIAFCDHDDLWAPTYLERYARLLRAAPEVELAFCDFRVLRGGGPDPGTKFDGAPPGYWERAGRRVLPEGWVFDGDLAAENFLWQPIFPSAMALRKRLAEAVGGYEERLSGVRSQDGEFTLRCLYRARVGAVPEPLVGYRRHGLNVTRDRLANLLDEVKVLRFIARHHPEARRYAGAIDGQIGRRRIRAFDLAFSQRDHAVARELLADMAWRDRSARLWLKTLCVMLPGEAGLALNALLQRASEASARIGRRRTGGADPARLARQALATGSSGRGAAAGLRRTPGSGVAL